DKKTRSNIGEIAVRAAESVDYLNAGTAEFLRDGKGNFYFIEVNSRLQVEHPVTELVTGIDLVKLQIKIACGEEIPFKQSELELNGSAIECRINAEDPFHDFVPSVGLVPDCNLPYGPGVRVDTYLYPGCSVSGYYDSLVAKLITWGQDFNEARVRMSNALDEFMIEGINTTIPLYRTIMNEKNFIQGNISTDYLEKYDMLNQMQDQLKEKQLKSADSSIAAALLYSEYLKGQSAINSSNNLSLSNWVRTGSQKNGI
ncbi:MAG: acetyl-CoA carboxylase biotin carboxylase subunit, partial [Nitrososphaeraceae archaeon]|nr:acetyl-CoA carboxylase biotin carboxylase subunit [Nitrososphaeraceae archaeon]